AEGRHHPRPTPCRTVHRRRSPSASPSRRTSRRTWRSPGSPSAVGRAEPNPSRYTPPRRSGSTVPRPHRSMSAVSCSRLVAAIAQGRHWTSTCHRTPLTEGPAIVPAPRLVLREVSSNDRPCRSHLHHAFLLFRSFRLWRRDVEGLVRPPGKPDPPAAQVACSYRTLAILLDDQQPAAAIQLHGVSRHHAGVGDVLDHPVFHVGSWPRRFAGIEEADTLRADHQAPSTPVDDVRHTDEAGHEFVRRVLVQV